MTGFPALNAAAAVRPKCVADGSRIGLGLHIKQTGD